MPAKFSTYVAVFFDEPDTGKTIVKYVTGVGRSTASWESDQPAMKFDSESFAKDVVYGLTLNGYAAAVVKVLYGVELRN